jgi:phospholipase/carboxylesterase
MFRSEGRVPLSLEAITIPPKSGKPPTGIIVMLHGWGANCQDLAPLAPMLNFPDFLFLFADAPFPHPQVPGGRMWYDLNSPDYQKLPESQDILTAWLRSLEGSTGIPLSRTLLSGFSQGGAMTLDVGLQLPLAGLVSMSGYLHCEPQPQGDRFAPTLIMHGTDDPIVPVSAAYQVREVFQALGVPVQYQEFPMGHSIVPEQLQVMQTFIEAIFPTFEPTYMNKP